MAEKHIPEEIIVKILSKLPVKSLLRFRCVSKRWRSIVSDPQFAKFQFKVASEQKTLSRRLLLDLKKSDEFESIDLEMPWSRGESDNPSSIRKLIGRPIRHAEWIGPHAIVLGCCNGLVCVGTQPTRDFGNQSTGIRSCIWNPTTGFSHKLPDLGFHNDSRGEGYLRYSGFGYLPATEDYKLVVATAVSRHESVDVNIFSTRTGLWKRIESPFNYAYTFGKLLGKALHWVCNIPGILSPVLYAFDLEEEKFGQMPLPTLLQDDKSSLLEGVDPCGGCLYGFFYRHNGVSEWLELWVMREYGVRDSWTKLSTVY